jgi:hypothetical protein
MKRKLKWLAIVLAVSLLGFGTALLLWPRDRITADSWHKIRIGMTEDEVAEILGGPGRNFQEANTEILQLEIEVGRPFEWEMEKPAKRGLVVIASARVWSGRRGIIVIELDQDNQVCWKAFQALRWLNGNVFDRLRDWLGW